MQLSAWTSNTEKSVITAAEIAPPLAEQAPPPNGVAPKGYQQITGWQVRICIFLSGMPGKEGLRSGPDMAASPT